MEKVVVIGIVTDKDKVLIVKRKKNEKGLLWQFPGGEVEHNETFEKAIIREMKEETGINIKCYNILGKRIHPNTKKEIVYISCGFLSGELQISDDDLEEVKWVRIIDLKSYFTTPIFDKVEKFLGID